MNQGEEEKNCRREQSGDLGRIGDQDLHYGLFLWITGMESIHTTEWP